MRKESAGVTEALLKSAEQEFLAHGFHDASLRRISAESGVSTNSIYTRFGDKAGLFETLVKPAADGLMQIYMDSVQAASDVSEVTDAIACGNRGTDDVLVYIYKNFNAFRLIFCCSAGTEYETYFDRLAEIEESYYKKFAVQFSAGEKVDDFFIHVICRTGWQYVYELVSHNMDFEKAKLFMNDIRKYSYAGWKAVLGLI